MNTLKNSIMVLAVFLIAYSSFYFFISNNQPVEQKNTLIELAPDSATELIKQQPVVPSSKPVIALLKPQRNLSVAYRFSNIAEYEQTSAYGTLPSHLQGLAMEKFAYDANGELILDDNIKHIIEFFLVTAQVEGRDQAIARIKEYINFTLPEPAASQAAEITDNYLAYKEGLMEHDFAISGELGQAETTKGIKAALAAKKQIRRQHLGNEVSDVLFGEEERYDDFSIARIEINANTELNDEEKDQRLAKAEQGLPAEAAEKMRKKREENHLNKKISSLRKEGGNTEKIYALRKDFYGEKVADRLAYVEDDSPAWRNKVSQFQQESHFIESQTHLSAAERKRLIIEKKQEIFSQPEQIKLAVQSIRNTRP